MNDVTVRPMTTADVDTTLRIQIDAFTELDRGLGEDPSPVTDVHRERGRRRHEHFVTHDPDGAFVATVDDRIIGCALALRRDDLWGLSLLAVDPASQSGGAGRKLLDASLSYAEGCERAVILSSPDPRAIRAYGTSGFDLYPQVRASGTPDLARRPRQRRKVRAGAPTDTEFANAVDRSVRGAARGDDHAVVAAVGATMIVVDDADGRGYACLRDGDVYLLAATDDSTAGALIWHCFEVAKDNDQTITVEHITGEQQWAIDACFAARLRIAPSGPVFWRGATPPRAYLPSGAFL